MLFTAENILLVGSILLGPADDPAGEAGRRGAGDRRGAE